jgi:hypothetical protein
MNKLIITLSIVILVIAGAVGWTYLNKPISVPISQTENPIVRIVTPTPPKEQIPVATNTISEKTPLKYVNPSVTIDAFETAIPAKKYTDLAEFMTPTVTVIKYATSCCGPLTKANAISEMSYLSNAIGPWNFSETNPIALKLAVSDPDHFKEAFIGTSANLYAVGFVLNDDYLISKVIITNNYQLITGQ